jgi:Secretion system C-terminal sorting domain/Reeler domain
MKLLSYGVFAFIGIAIICLSNALGPVARQQRGYTGAPGDQPNTCATCHNTGTFNPTAALQVLDSLGSSPVTRYQPGRQYTIRMTITAAAGTPSAYGFQMIDLRTQDNSNVKGFLPKAQQAENIGVDTIRASGRVYAGHNARLSSNIINVKWKAPASDVGTVIFYAAGNAANTSSSSAGDNGTPSVNIQLPSPSSTIRVNELEQQLQLKLAPNPAVSNLNIRIKSEVSKTLQIRLLDLAGRVVKAENWALNTGENNRQIDVDALDKGVYLIQLSDGQNVVARKIIKQ